MQFLLLNSSDSRSIEDVLAAFLVKAVEVTYASITPNTNNEQLAKISIYLSKQKGFTTVKIVHIQNPIASDKHLVDHFGAEYKGYIDHDTCEKISAQAEAQLFKYQCETLIKKIPKIIGCWDSLLRRYVVRGMQDEYVAITQFLEDRAKLHASSIGKASDHIKRNF